ncbi:cytochrome-b5 reductase [Fistulifera solaris]|uniref:NADH-cytochrome b5 reductase n=1 Tax=Fistulifera solaris TaxID=1519565 RepID=A0A1Z5KG03_FISSO|nr:cytochrome-b5 reductase [Fistulifera solaris]|eukprot:GAX25147.1 cytochrome-b5 reductase [Fistulifera solaris]
MAAWIGILVATTILLITVYLYQLVSRPSKILPLEDFVQVPLIRKEILSHDTRRFTFALPRPDAVLGLPVGQHVALRFQQADETWVQRSYTPTQQSVPGEFSLVIKVYSPAPPKFPTGGALSQHLDSLAIGDTIGMKGPKGHIEWLSSSKGQFSVKPLGKPLEQRTCQYVGMMAGGTGITPMLQLLHAIFADPDPSLKVKLIYANQTEDDILVRQELEHLQQQYPQHFSLWYTLDRPPTQGWKYSTGFISPEMVQQHLVFAEDTNKTQTQFFLCGPAPMIKFACLPALEQAGYNKDNWVIF